MSDYFIIQLFVTSLGVTLIWVTLTKAAYGAKKWKTLTGFGRIVAAINYLTIGISGLACSLFFLHLFEDNHYMLITIVCLFLHFITTGIWYSVKIKDL